MKKLLALALLLVQFTTSYAQNNNKYDSLYNNISYPQIQARTSFNLPVNDNSTVSNRMPTTGAIRVTSGTPSQVKVYRNGAWDSLKFSSESYNASFNSYRMVQADNTFDPVGGKDGMVAAKLKNWIFVFRGWNQVSASDSVYYRSNITYTNYTNLGNTPMHRGHNGAIWKINDSTVIMAGGDALFGVDTSIWRFQLTGPNDSVGTFTKISHMPSPRILFAYWQIGTDLYIGGGQTDYVGTGDSSIIKSTDGGINWTVVNAGQPNWGMNMSGTCVVLGDTIFRFSGGVYAPVRTYTNIFEYSTDGAVTWDTLPTPPAPARAYTFGIAQGGKAYYFGGTNADISSETDGNLDDMWFFKHENGDIVWYQVVDSSFNPMHATFAVANSSTQISLIGGSTSTTRTYNSDFRSIDYNIVDGAVKASALPYITGSVFVQFLMERDTIRPVLLASFPYVTIVGNQTIYDQKTFDGDVAVATLAVGQPAGAGASQITNTASEPISSTYCATCLTIQSLEDEYAVIGRGSPVAGNAFGIRAHTDLSTINDIIFAASSGAGVGTIRFQVTGDGKVYIFTTPATDNTNTFVLSRDGATGFVEKMTVAATASASSIAQRNASGELFASLFNSGDVNTYSNNIAAIYSRKTGGSDNYVYPTSAQPITRFLMEESVTSSGTVSMASTTNTFYVFTGTTSTFTLPAISASRRIVYLIKNRGSGNITVNTAAAGNDIYDASAVNTMTILPGAWLELREDGTYFNVTDK